jgi:uncharacterized protein (TIGR01777 family)
VTQRHVLLTGASGLIGTALAAHLTASGFVVHKLARDASSAAFNYDSNSKTVVLDSSIPLYAAVNLAGPSIADGRWSESRKRDILENRRDLTHALSSALASASTPPAVYLSASAIGYYGPSPDQEPASPHTDSCFDEHSPAGDDFLAEVGKSWEAATLPARDAGIPTVHLRFGVVMSTRGGVLGKMLLPFSLCLGGRLGSGSQRMSWISLPDAIGVLSSLLNRPEQAAALADDNGATAINLVNALNRPTVLPLPSPVINLLFGEMGSALLLGSAAVCSTKVQALDYTLQHPSIEGAIEHLVSNRL